MVVYTIYKTVKIVFLYVGYDSGAKGNIWVSW